MITKERSGQFIGDYIVQADLGPSLYGDTCLAVHKILQREHLLIALPKGLPSLYERLRLEGSDIARLDHPHILKLESISEIEGTYYLIYETPGRESVLLSNRQKGLSEEFVETVGREIAAALDFAHNLSFGDQPLAHGCLKASSIFLHPKRGVLLAHFGLSRILGIKEIYRLCYGVLWEEQPSELFEILAALGPESRGQLSTSRDLDALSDCYGFGALLYQLLLETRAEGLFPMPSEKKPHLKRNWDPVIRGLLEIDPEKRATKLLELFDFSKMGSSVSRLILEPQILKRPKEEQEGAPQQQFDQSVAVYTPKIYEVKEVEPIPSEMVVVEGGTFLMGSNNGARDEMPRHAVHLSPFAIDVHPVTNEQFVRFLAIMGGEKDENNNDMIRLRDSRIQRKGGKLLIESGYAKHPVTGVSWYGAHAYAGWVGKRLPTEAEWEVAAAGGTEGAQYPMGDSIERSEANFFNSDTTTIKSYPPNQYGLYDMSGNVYEWCLDWYAYHYYEISLQEPDNPKGPKQGVYRVLRGGCWKSLKEDLRVSHRHRNKPGITNGTYGFRCATDATH